MYYLRYIFEKIQFDLGSNLVLEFLRGSVILRHKSKFYHNIAVTIKYNKLFSKLQSCIKVAQLSFNGDSNKTHNFY